MIHIANGEAMPKNLTDALIRYESLREIANASDDDAYFDRMTPAWIDIKEEFILRTRRMKSTRCST